MKAVQALIAQKDAFDKKGTLPTAAELQTAASSYQQARDQANKALLAAYKEAVTELTKQLEIDEASAIDKEMKAFAAKLDTASLTPQLPAEPTSTGSTLRQARTEYQEALLEAKQNCLKAIEGRLKEVAAEGDLNRVKAIQSLLRMIEDDKEVQTPTDLKLKSALVRYGSDQAEARGDLASAYRAAIAKAAKQGNEEAAAELQTDLETNFHTAVFKLPRIKYVPARVMASKKAGSFGEPFKELAPNGGILVGFIITRGEIFNKETVQSIQAIYQNEDHLALGKQYGEPKGKEERYMAKPGYAVGGINANAGLLIDGLEIIFMKVKGKRLDPRDAYKSPFIGSQGGRRTSLIGAGQVVVGIQGGHDKELKSLGLIVAP